MQIEKAKNGNVLTVRVLGRLDANSAPELEASINPELSDISELNMDFSHLAYISSAGLRILLSMHKAMVGKGGCFKVLHPCDEVMEVIEMTGFATFLVIEK